jgi:uroporphyrinogen III methyltransferase/synthase
VNGFVDVLAENKIDIHNISNNPLIACIGQVTASAVREVGLQVHIEAKEHTIKGLVKAMKEYINSVVE